MSVALFGTPVSDFAFGTTTTVTKQTGLVNGYWLIWQVVNGIGNNGTPSINTPAGFTLIDTITIVSGVNRSICHAIFKRKVDGSEGATFTCTGGATAGSPAMASIMSAYSGCDPTDCIDTESKNSGASTGTTVTALGVTVTGSGGLLLGIQGDWETDRGPLTGMTQIVNSAGNGLTLDNEVSTPGATGNLTCSCSATEVWTVFLVSLKAAAAAGGVSCNAAALHYVTA